MLSKRYNDNDNDNDLFLFSKLVAQRYYTTRIEPVGEPYREVCQSPWKGNWRMS